jgi:uncharacterized metal-binding protein YceD (DUF177 family)
MTDICVIHIDRLKEGKSLKIEETFSPKDLDLGDDSLTFDSRIEIKGNTYLAEDHLVIQLDIKGSAIMPCLVCNKETKIPFFLKNVYITKPTDDISSGSFSFKDDLREAIYLDLPAYAECQEGDCPERKNMQNYLKQSSSSGAAKKEDHYFPFNSLEDQLKKI